MLSGRQARAIENADFFVVGSTVGSVREKNEDIGAITTVRYSQEPSRDYSLALICDGMGGMSNGRAAALVAASTFISAFLRNHRSLDPQRSLAIALQSAHDAVFSQLRGAGGTTLSAAYANNSQQAWFVHVGDSRVYAVRLENELRQVSRDDTIGAALQRAHENRPDNNRLIQFVGMEGEIDPQIQSIDRGALSGLLLTSDGAHSAPPDIMSTIAKHAKAGPDLVRKLLNVADALGGLDNATAVHLPFGSGSASEQAEPGPYNDAIAQLLCSSGLHDIWFGILQPVDIEAAPGRSTSYSHNAGRATPDIKNKKKPRQPKQKPKDDVESEVPLAGEKPVAKLDFSDDGDR